MTAHRLTLFLHQDNYAVARVDPGDGCPDWPAARSGTLCSQTWTDRELSIVCPADRVPAHVNAERGWRLLEVEGPLPFELTGVLASIAGPLAEDEVNLFVVSSFETDYVLVPDRFLDRAIAALLQAGHEVRTL
ncbi:ACT domain-containing protein [Tautonia marina]|uniref:ACT domain-containing protein n=1 Tax=Tautonia marina TaxID=2653855 RepID=UPI001260781B|nr:ACT domain-containing protein [Tautonia marina]